MKPFENEQLQPEETTSGPEPEAQAEAAAESASEQASPSGYYHGVGAGQREAPFARTPYATYHSNQDDQQPYYDFRQPYGTYQQPEPAKPPKKKKHYGKKILKGTAAVIVAAVLVVASCGITAGFTSMYWNNQYDSMMQYMNEKVAALKEQIAEQEYQSGVSGGVVESVGGSLTPGEIYSRNVSSVVALTCALTGVSNGESYTATSSGTGFVITSDGYIVTNHHVVDGAVSIAVTMANGKVYNAQLIGSDATNDVALIKVDATGMKPVTLGVSGAMRVGDQVVAIGNALGELTSSLTVGYVSGMDRNVSTDGTVINMLQTDVAINSGNSGGPLFNARGEVIGITTAKYSGTTSSGASIEGISFAIPIDDVLDTLDDLKNFGYVKSAYLGVYVADVDPATANYYGFPVGVYVSSTMPGFCAEKAGVMPKDIIVDLGGYEITCMSDLSRALRVFEAGETVTMKVWRSGREIILTVTLDEKPQQ